MFARVIPYTKTLRGVDWFDYHIPEDLTVTPGMTVWVEFRRKKIPGLVWSIANQTTAKRIKSVQGPLPQAQQYWEAPIRLQLLEWFARYYAVSLPTAWKTLQWSYLKRKHTTTETQLAPSFSSPSPTPSRLILWNHQTDLIAYYKQIIAASQGTIVIIVPEYQRVTELQQALHLPLTDALLTTEPSPTRLHRLQQQLATTDDPMVVIGTKKLLGLDAAYIDTLIIDHADSHSHKQFDSNPRYHVNTVVEHIAHLYPALQLVYTSSCPPLRLAQQVREKKVALEDLRRPWAHAIEIIDMNHASHPDTSRWLSEPLLDAMRSSARSFLLLNRMGEFRVSQCRDCQQLNPIDRSNCQSCQSLNLKQLRYGTRAIETELHRLFPDRTIIRIDNQQADLTATAVEAADIIIGTEKALRWVDLETVDVIGVVSVDHLLVYPHFQAHERVWQLLTTVLVAERPTWVQTWSPHNTVITTACRNRYWEFAKPELDLRSQLALPPFGDSIRLMNHRTGVTTVTRTPMDLTTIDPDVLIDRVE